MVQLIYSKTRPFPNFEASGMTSTGGFVIKYFGIWNAETCLCPNTRFWTFGIRLWSERTRNFGCFSTALSPDVQEINDWLQLPKIVSLRPITDSLYFLRIWSDMTKERIHCCFDRLSQGFRKHSQAKIDIHLRCSVFEAQHAFTGISPFISERIRGPIPFATDSVYKSGPICGCRIVIKPLHRL
jgi:hypothetical protein